MHYLTLEKWKRIWKITNKLPKYLIPFLFHEKYRTFVDLLLEISNMKTLKFKSILFVAISFFPVWLQAKQVSQETALQVAQTHVRSHSQLRSAQSLTLNLVHTETTDIQPANANLRTSGIASTNVVYYVYNVEGNGFVIVSGDDVAMPVLGYSDSGTYNPDNLSPNFAYYLNCFSQEIKGAITNDLPQSEETKKQWDAYLAGNVSPSTATAANTPLLDKEGIAWGQTAPFNLLCPMINNTQTVTGCVATAMAQIMRYFKYPATGSGTAGSYSSYNIDSTVVIKIPSKNLSQSIYDWNNMPPVYNSNSTSTQQNAVALLMYDCGISAYMQYDISTNGSGAYNWDAGNALINNFSYSKGLTYKERKFYSDNEWDTLLKAEIDAERPVLYGGQDTINNVGHTFVCDGYDGNYFHFNWGWNGGGNGYFLSSALNVQGTPTYYFNQYQEVLVGIDRSTGSGNTTNYEIILDDGSTQPMAFTSTKTQVINNNKDPFNVVAQWYFNIGFSSVNGFPGVALYNQANQLVYVLGLYNKTTINLQPMSSGSGISWTGITIPSSVPAGNYFIKPIVISTSNDTIPVHVAPEKSLPLTVIDNITGLEEIDSNLANSLNVNVYETNGLIQVTTVDSNQIKEIDVYDLQGALIYKAASIDAISYTVNRKLPTGAYIVKVISEKNTDNVKLILH